METDNLSPGVDDGLLPQGSYNKEDDDCDLQDASDIKCGISKCKPQCLQGCANIRAYTVSISLSLLFVISGLTYYVGMCIFHGITNELTPIFRLNPLSVRKSCFDK